MEPHHPEAWRVARHGEPEPEKAKPDKFWEDLEENLKDAKFRRAYVKDFQKLMGDR